MVTPIPPVAALTQANLKGCGIPRILTRSFIFLLPIVGAVVAVSLLALTLGGPTGKVSTASAAACSPALPHAPGTTTETIVSGSVSRQYDLQVPPAYDGTTALPLVFLLHGRGSTASVMPFYSKLGPKATAEGFILVSPQGVVGVGGSTWWNNSLIPGYPDDVLFVDDMIDELVSELCVDEERIFSTGISNGAMMSVRLACSLSSRIAAIAPVAGVYYPPWSTDLTFGEPCPDTRPVPIIAFHGTADVTIPFDGGTSSLGVTGLRDIDDAVMPDWATHNGCSATPAFSTAASGVQLTEYPGCANGATTLLYAVQDGDGPGPLTEGGGHTWPDAALDISSLGLTTHQISATNLMWDFFEAHPMQQAGPPTPAPVGGAVELVGDSPGGGTPGAAVLLGIMVAAGIALLGTVSRLRVRRH